MIGERTNLCNYFIIVQPFRVTNLHSMDVTERIESLLFKTFLQHEFYSKVTLLSKVPIAFAIGGGTAFPIILIVCFQDLEK